MHELKLMFVYVWSLQQRPEKMAAILADLFLRFDLFDVQNLTDSNNNYRSSVDS
jgi:hypothetical protein